MGLISRTVITRWKGNNRKHYESKGYVFTKINDEFEVKVEDLPDGSGVKVNVQCSECRELLEPMKWQDYLRYVKEDEKYYCKSCVQKLYGNEKYRISRLKNSESLGYWLIKNLPLKQAIEIINRWDDELNQCDIRDIAFSSIKKCYFKCPRNIHPSELKRISDFTSGKSSLICIACNSLGQYIIDNYSKDFINDIWSEKNKKSPFEFASNSTRYVWWKCLDKKHEDYYRSIKDSNNYDFRCSSCVQEMKESVIQNKTRLYLEELNFNVLHEHNCSIIPTNPKTKYPLPFDNEIVLINNKRLICEVNGIQHYQELPEGNQWLNGKTPKEYLHYQQVKDRYKRMYAKYMGYEYLELPYCVFDKEDVYKRLIDDKINKILNNRGFK